MDVFRGVGKFFFQLSLQAQNRLGTCLRLGQGHRLARFERVDFINKRFGGQGGGRGFHKRNPFITHTRLRLYWNIQGDHVASERINPLINFRSPLRRFRVHSALPLFWMFRNREPHLADHLPKNLRGLGIRGEKPIPFIEQLFFVWLNFCQRGP